MEGKRIGSNPNRWIWRAVSLFIILALCFSLAPQGQPALAATCKFKHKVVPGDTLVYLGQLYQIDWREIAKANNLVEPYVLIIDQVICIPGGTAPSTTSTSSTTTKDKATLTVIGGLNDVTVSVEKFPPKTVYFVRVETTDGSSVYRIGLFSTNKEGEFTDYFKVPIVLAKHQYLVLCVKNAWTDKTTCVTYENPFWFINRTVTYKCDKNGR